MRFLKVFNIFLVVIVSLTFVFSEKIHAQNSATVLNEVTPLAIAIPTNGQVITSTSLTISGKAPAGALITVTIQDEDYQKTFQVHEMNLIFNGTTTSDKNGDWVFIPPSNLVPGRFSVSVSYLNASNASINTDKVFFSVADSSGSTSWFTIPGGTLLILTVLIIVALLIIIFKFVGVKKRKIYIHTSLGDIPAREIIDENNNVEIVPLSEPMINLGPPMQPVTYALQGGYVPMQQTMQVNPVIQQNYQQPQPQNFVQPVINTPIINTPQPIINQNPLNQAVQPVIQQPVVSVQQLPPQNIVDVNSSIPVQTRPAQQQVNQVAPVLANVNPQLNTNR